MKSNVTDKPLPVTDKEWEELERQAPEHVDDPECPYDPNDSEAVEAFWKDAVLVEGGGPKAVREALKARRQGQRSPQKAPTKVAVSLRLSREVIEYFKAGGQGWQSRIDAVLKSYIESRR